MTQSALKRKLIRTAAGFYRKARQYGRPSTVTAEDLARIYLEAEGQCYYCGAVLDPILATFDHVMPFERGGSNTLDNVVLSCLTDNRQKFTMNEAEYREWLRVERMCRTCGKRFKPRPADYRRGFGFYCSRRCSGTAGGAA